MTNQINYRCEICGVDGADVIALMAYVGGRGHQERRRCAELLACWRRFDAKEKATGADTLVA